MQRATLEEAIRRSGGVLPAGDELDRVLVKIDGLRQTGRYNRMLQQLGATNDRSNFQATLLEATFASQFEVAGAHLAYEIKQTPQTPGSVDFRHTYCADHLDFELRLVQQEYATTEQIRQQLDQGPFFEVAMDANADLRTIVRAQNIILSKIQNPKDSTAVKFAAPQEHVTNIVVIDTHDLFLGGIDVYDCKLIAYGDPAVPEEHRRDAFGLFQQCKQDNGDQIRARYNRFSHARSTIHGLMFLFHTPGSGVFDYGLRQFTMWNPALMSRERGIAAVAEIQRAIPFNG